MSSKIILNISRNINPIASHFQPIRNRHSYYRELNIPKPGIKGKDYRRRIHFEKEYTVKPLNVTNLAGRDPVTGNY